MSDDKRAVILVSGGMDSATAVYEAMDRGYDLYFLHTSYGQQTEGKECGRLPAHRNRTPLGDWRIKPDR
jgi:7-cyano-7-deazaguanine synthase